MDARITTRFLRTHPLLALIPLFTLRRLIARAALEEFPKGAQVYQQGEACSAVYLVISGRCEGRLPGGEVEMVYGPGEALGARELFNNEPYRSTVTILTDCVLLRIPAPELEKIFADKPSVAGRFSQSLFRPQREPRRRRGRSGRVVSLVSLAEGAQPERVEQALAGALHGLGRGSVLFVRLAMAVADGLALEGWPQLAARCQAFSGEFCLGAHLRETDAGFSEMKIAVRGSASEPGHLPGLLSHLAQHFDFVLLRIAPGLPEPVATELLVQADVAYVFLRQNSEEVGAFHALLQRLEPRQSAPVRAILCGEPFVPMPDFEGWQRELGRPVHAFIAELPDEGESPASRLHLNRLAREIAQCRIGLALSSGGARGLAHIGVIQVLEENGIEVDVVAGSSMGAYVGAAWAYGYDGAMLEKLAREMERRFGLLHLIEPVLPPRRGFMRSSRVARRLRRSIGTTRFHELLRPLRIVATRLETMERVVFSSGEVARAVEASIAIPGICVPVEVGGELYIDGGIADPLPVDVLVEMGVEKIIAVNTIPTPEQLRLCVEQEAEPERTRLGAFFNRHLNYFARGNILDTLFRSTHGVQMRVAEMACRDADVTLWTIASDARWHDFTNPGKYIALGRRVAQAHLEELKRLTKGGPDAKPNPHPPMAVVA